MARPTKKGLDYFPHACEYDDELNYIISKYKAEGHLTYFSILQKIYSLEGYFMKASDKNIVLLSGKINVDINLINEIINDCLSEQLFDRKLYEKYNILTSASIQSRYFEAIKRRKEIEIIDDYILIDIVSIIGINVNINRENAYNNTQSKVKEIKDTVEKNDGSNEYKNFVEIWFTFYEKQTGIKPKYNATAGKKMKSIIKYLNNLASGKNYSAQDLFEQILGKWNILDKWQRENCLDLNIFETKLPVIITQLKNSGINKHKNQYEQVRKELINDGE